MVCADCGAPVKYRGFFRDVCDCKKEKKMKSLKHEDWYCCWTNSLERDAMIQACYDKGLRSSESGGESIDHCVALVYSSGAVSGRYSTFLDEKKEISVSEFWQRLAIDDDYPEELPPIKTANALKAMEGCSDVKRVFKTLYSGVF